MPILTISINYFRGDKIQKANTAYNGTNATQNWSGNNTAINISSLVNNVTHPPNASAPNASKNYDKYKPSSLFSTKIHLFTNFI